MEQHTFILGGPAHRLTKPFGVLDARIELETVACPHGERFVLLLQIFANFFEGSGWLEGVWVDPAF
jgi:hypothetical protein